MSREGGFADLLGDGWRRAPGKNLRGEGVCERVSELQAYVGDQMRFTAGGAMPSYHFGSRVVFVSDQNSVITYLTV